MYMCTYIYIYVCVHVCMCIHIYICTYVEVLDFVGVHVTTCTFMCIHIRAYVHVHVHVRIPSYTYVDCLSSFVVSSTAAPRRSSGGLCPKSAEQSQKEAAADTGQQR